MSNNVPPRLRDALFSAIEGYEQVGEDLDVARTHIRLARISRKQMAPAEAKSWARQALEFGVRAELPLYQALAHRQYGMALETESILSEGAPARQEWLLEQAEHHLRESLAILGTLQDGFETAMSQRALGAMLARRARWNPDQYLAPAKELLETARATFLSLQAKIELEKTERALGFAFAIWPTNP
jgi:hypothetical protein